MPTSELQLMQYPALLSIQSAVLAGDTSETSARENVLSINASSLIPAPNRFLKVPGLTDKVPIYL